MRRNRLDLPLPFGPWRIRAPPRGTAKPSPAKTWRSPRTQVRSRPSNNVMAGAKEQWRGISALRPRE